MNSALPKPIQLKNVRVNGVAVANAEKGTTFPVLVRAELTSDQPEFYSFMKSISGLVVSRANEAGVRVIMDKVSILLLVTHVDGAADLYLQDIPMNLEVLAKRDVAAGELVFLSGVADVRRLRIPGLEIRPKDGVVICFKVGWKFALFFDLAPNRVLDVDGMERSLGSLYRQLSFQALYETLGDDGVFGNLVSVGWFPFVEIIGGEFEALLKAVREGFNVVEETSKLLKRFDRVRIDAIGQRWWKRPALTNRENILMPALEAFKRGDSVSCLKIILTEIEGIIQEAHIADLKRSAQIKDLLKYAVDKGVKKTGDTTSLLFPHHFLRYLSDYTYSNFDPKKPGAGAVSRHSVGHGSALAASYTQERALQAILTLDQISFYL